VYTDEPGNRLDERLTSGYTGRLLITLSVGYLFLHLGRNILPPLLPAIIADLAISPFLAGFALTVLSATYALSMYPGGHLSDQLTRKTTLVAAVTIGIVGLTVLMSATTYPLFLLGVIVFGLSGGLYWISLRALLADLFRSRRGQAFGVQDAVGFVGPLVAAGAAILIIGRTSWRMAFPVLIIGIAGIGVLAHRWVRGPYEISTVEFDFLKTGTRVFGDRHVRWLAVAYSCVVFSMHSVIGFLPTFLQIEKGFSPTIASVGFGVLFAGAMITMPISGFLGDRLSRTPVALGGLTLSIVGLVTFLFSRGAVVIGVGIFCFGIGVWAFPPVIQAHLMTRFPDAKMGGDFGVFKTVYSGAGSVGPAYIGFIASTSSYLTAFLTLLFTLSVSILILFRVS